MIGINSRLHYVLNFSLLISSTYTVNFYFHKKKSKSHKPPNFCRRKIFFHFPSPFSRSFSKHAYHLTLLFQIGYAYQSAFSGMSNDYFFQMLNSHSFFLFLLVCIFLTLTLHAYIFLLFTSSHDSKY